MPLEKSIQARILKWINSLEGGIAENVMGNAFQFGRPDINACFLGRSIRIEVKTPDHGNKPSKAQEIDIKKWRRAGCLAFVAYSLEDVQKIFEEEFGDELRGRVPQAKETIHGARNGNSKTKKEEWSPEL